MFIFGATLLFLFAYEANGIKITVKKRDDELFEVDVATYDTILALKKAIKKAIDPDGSLPRISFKGKEFTDNKAAVSGRNTGISAGDTVTIIE